ncbi:MAG: DUF1552 domain-containing protein [Myxococcota bacterium]
MIRSRRWLLRNAGLWAAAWPLMRSQSLMAAGPSRPRRVVIIFTPNGPQFETGPTEGAENDFSFHDWWSPLQRVRDDGLFFRGCHQAGVPFGELNEYGHQSGHIGALTARTTEGTNTSTGPSLDQFIGQELQRRGIVTPMRSLLMGLYDKARSPFFEAAGKAVAPIYNPYKLLESMAPNFGSEASTAVDSVLHRKHFVLDQVANDCRTLRSELDSSGKEMLDFHCSNIESLETAVLQSMRERPASCAAPSGPISGLSADANWLGRESRDDAMRAFTDLMALAFTCDMTRVAAFSFGSGAARFSIPEKYDVPVSGKVNSGDSGPQMHAWTHQSKDNPDTYKALRIFYHWFSERVIDVIDTLKSTHDADGSPLFDSTLVLWTSEFGSGGPHTNRMVPVMLFGNGCGEFVTGRHFSAHAKREDSKEDRALALHELFVSIIRHTGLTDIDSFGNAGRGPLEWLAG